jgi:hypothetical protein
MSICIEGKARSGMATNITDTKHNLYKSVASGASDSGVFGAVEIDEHGVSCAAQGSAEPAFYRVVIEDGQVWISLETIDRWLSGSIEADLVNTGDKLEELLEEEINDLGHVDAKVEFEHFRSSEMMYVFRSRLSTEFDDPNAAEHALIWLLGYEVVLRELGDMDDSSDEG